jgi:hypothetical protein
MLNTVVQGSIFVLTIFENALVEILMRMLCRIESLSQVVFLLERVMDAGARKEVLSPCLPLSLYPSPPSPSSLQRSPAPRNPLPPSMPSPPAIGTVDKRGRRRGQEKFG